MDTITHTLFGLTLYGALNKQKLDPKLKKPLLFTAIVGSQIPDIDVISKLWDMEGKYQMWHRGITHSVFLVPVWALVILLLCYLFWRVKDKRIFFLGSLAVFIHNTSDLFNAWGTGYLEPFSMIRITFGTIPIIDFLVWGIILVGFVLTKITRYPSHAIYKGVWLLILLHFTFQSIQGYVIHERYAAEYDQLVLAAEFTPGHFAMVGMKGNQVEISQVKIVGEPTLITRLESAKQVDLTPLFEENPKAQTLFEWSPFVVVIDDDERLGIYDPRFYRNGSSFLYEYIEKN